jgi:hypothetical protein
MSENYRLSPNEWIDLYMEQVNIRHGLVQIVAQLGALASSAAAWLELQDAPENWEWPIATEGFNGE